MNKFLGLFLSKIRTHKNKKKSPTIFIYEEQYLICGLLELLKDKKKIQHAGISLSNESGDYSSSSLDLVKKLYERALSYLLRP